MNIKAIIFDKDGTLLDFDRFWVTVAENAAAYICESLNAPKTLIGKMLASVGVKDGVSDIGGALCSGTYEMISELFASVLSEAGARFDRAEFYGLTLRAFHDCSASGEIVPTCEGLSELLSYLKRRGLILALVTTDDAHITGECLRALGIDGCFAHIYCDDGVHPTKPDPYYLNRLLEAEGLTADEVMMVGDTLTDLSFAARGGTIGVGVAKTASARALLEPRAYRVIEDVSHLPELL